MGSLPAIASVRSVAVDPETPQRVYSAGPAGLFRSYDAGLTWIDSGIDLAVEPLAVALDPSDPMTIFVVTTDDAVWRSLGGGSTWQRAWPVDDPAP